MIGFSLLRAPAMLRKSFTDAVATCQLRWRKTSWGKTQSGESVSQGIPPTAETLMKRRYHRGFSRWYLSFNLERANSRDSLDTTGASAGGIFRFHTVTAVGGLFITSLQRSIHL